METRRFIVAFTRDFPFSLVLARPIQSLSPHPSSTRSILMLSIHLYIGLPSGPFHASSPTNNLYTFLLSPIRATYSAHLILLDLIILIILGEESNPSSPRHAVLSAFPSLHPSSVQIFSSVPCSQTPSVYAPSLMTETKFHNHNKQTNSTAFSQQANYTNWATATCRPNLGANFVDKGVLRSQRGGSPTVANLSFLDQVSHPYRKIL
jgi:hypothetical protein